jgi:PadR family transcriptional regulator, regulatory protein PadR
MSDDGDWQAGWLRGVLELAVTAVLAEGARHGYALGQRLAERGFGQVRGGALYPVLGRLEGEGVVSATWEPGAGGPGRKVYTLTATGRRRLRAQRAQWVGFSAAMGTLLEALGDVGEGT